MDITAKFCQKEMEEYGACVASNPSAWQEQCHHLKVKVAQCTSSQYVYTEILPQTSAFHVVVSPGIHWSINSFFSINCSMFWKFIKHFNKKHLAHKTV